MARMTDLGCSEAEGFGSRSGWGEAEARTGGAGAEPSYSQHPRVSWSRPDAFGMPACHLLYKGQAPGACGAPTCAATRRPAVLRSAAVWCSQTNHLPNKQPISIANEQTSRMQAPPKAPEGPRRRPARGYPAVVMVQNDGGFSC